MPTVNGIEFPEDATPQEIQEFLASEGGGAAPTPNATPEREYGVRKVARDAINAIPMVQNTAAAFLTAPLKLGGPVGMAASGAIGAGAGVTGELQRQLMLRGLLGDRQALDPSRMGPAAVEGGVAGLGGHVAGKVVGAAGGAFRGMAPALGRVKAALRGRPGLVGDIIAATDAIPVRKPPVVKPPLGSEFSPSAFKAQRAASRAEQGRTSNFSEVPKPATKIAHSDDMVGPPTKRIRKANPKPKAPKVDHAAVRNKVRAESGTKAMQSASKPELERRAKSRAAAVNRLAPVPKPIEMDALLNQSLMLEEEMTRMGLDPFTKAQVRAAFRQGGR